MRIEIVSIAFLTFLSVGIHAQSSYTGRLIDEKGNPIAGASLRIIGEFTPETTSDENGFFELSSISLTDSVSISHLGYLTQILGVRHWNGLRVITMVAQNNQLQEVMVSTGYQSIPKERSTGSFTYVDNALFNRAASTDVISRLEAVTGGLAFIRKDVQGEQSTPPSLRIRGMSTIFSDSSPLIVLDNFPYEGSLDAINPNDIEDVTLLKDAASASIWGAKAGNGVIVIKTKQARYRESLGINVQASTNVGAKPYVYYDPAMKMTSASFLQTERRLFDLGFYDESVWNVLSPAVEAMIAHRNGGISGDSLTRYLDLLSTIDIRKDALAKLYQRQLNQQYTFSITGGSEKLRYYFSGGYDANQSHIVGNAMERYTTNTNMSFKPTSHLEIQAGINLTALDTRENGVGISGLTAVGKSRPLPYTRLLDDNHQPNGIPHQYRLPYVAEAPLNGLLDWQYRPLQELALNNKGNRGLDARFRAGVRYKFDNGLAIDVKTQYQRLGNNTYNRHHRDSYYARNYVNRFTQADGSQLVPLGAVWQGNDKYMRDNSSRGQLEFERQFGGHDIGALAGVEVRETVVRSGPGYLIYGMDEDILVATPRIDYSNSFPMLPQGNRGYIPAPSAQANKFTDRFISYYGNAAYSFRQRYTISGSVRFDQSNLFGVKVNQRGVPLWSLGAAWTLSSEPFYDVSILPVLKIRGTVGENGNVNKTVTAYPTASYGMDNLTGLPRAVLQNTGNPSLRWERVRSFNMAVDFASRGNRLAGSIEYYVKFGLDLLGDAIIDPTTGISGSRLRNRVNYADTRTKGWDLELKSENTKGVVNWSTYYLLSHVENSVHRYDDIDATNAIQYVIPSAFSPPVAGLPQNYLYSYPWHGLDANGNPLVDSEEGWGTNYSAYLASVERGALVYHGPTVPTIFGSVRNSIYWRGLTLSANISLRSGYYFRRPALVYANLHSLWEGHYEFDRRWVKPGDELSTQVPGHPNDLATMGQRDQLYQYSTLTALKGDHVRLEDIGLEYHVGHSAWGNMPFRNLNVAIYARNLGIIWRANKEGLDPDYPNMTYPPARTFAVTLRVAL